MKKKIKGITIILILLAISSTLYYTYANYYKPWKESVLIDVKAEDVNAEDISQTAGDDSTEITTAVFFNEYVKLDVPYINQLPELPTGCEITALTAVFKYMGYDVDKEVLAKDYLDKNDILDHGAFEYFFPGSPWDMTGWGCFSPALIKAANKYLSESQSSKQAYDISGSSVKDLLLEVQNGNPVIVWITAEINQKASYKSVTLTDGSIYSWPQPEHCVVLSGYNLNNPKTIILSDPLAGIVTRSYTKFNSRYTELHNRAIVIK